MDDQIQRVIAQVRPYSMVCDAAIGLTLERVIEAIEADRPGDFVECGTWMGGTSFAMLLVQRVRYGRIIKPVWMFDSFQGLPAADERDGPAALQYQAEPEGPFYYDNCTAPLHRVREAINLFGFSGSEAIVVPGWFNETIPTQIQDLSNSGISLLRVDCDWYEPVKYVLDELVKLIPEQGTIILDDYFAWDGCARATHDFLSEGKLPYRLRADQHINCAWMIKQSHRVL